jgi:hypothetical protein
MFCPNTQPATELPQFGEAPVHGGTIVPPKPTAALPHGRILG